MHLTKKQLRRREQPDGWQLWVRTPNQAESFDRALYLLEQVMCLCSGTDGADVAAHPHAARWAKAMHEVARMLEGTAKEIDQADVDDADTDDLIGVDELEDEYDATGCVA